MLKHGKPERIRAVAVVPLFPLPVDNGDSVRALQLLQSLAIVYDLTIFTVRRRRTQASDETAFRAALPLANVRIFHPEPIGGSNLPSRLLRWGFGLLTGTPPWIRAQFSSQLRRSLRRHAEAWGTGVLISEAAGIYASSVPSFHWHWDKNNVQSASSQLEISSAKNTRQRLFLSLYAHMCRRYERRCLRWTPCISVTSSDEASRLHDVAGRSAQVVLPSSVAIPPSPARINPRSKAIVWLGSLEYSANRIGLETFLASGWPLLTTLGYTLRVVGAGATEELRRTLRATPGVVERGFVPDLTIAFEGVSASVVPLWTGAGMKLKTLTCLAYGIPVVATPIAMEGIPTGAAAAIADTAEGLAMAIAEGDPNLFEIKGAEGRKLVASVFSRDSVDRVAREHFRDCGPGGVL